MLVEVPCSHLLARSAAQAMHGLSFKSLAVFIGILVLCRLFVVENVGVYLAAAAVVLLGLLAASLAEVPVRDEKRRSEHEY